MDKTKQKKLKHWLKQAMFVCVFVALSILPFRPAQAVCCPCCDVPAINATNAQWAITTPLIQQFVTNEFIAHRQWYIAVFWEDNILPALMLMADQLSAVAMQQTQIIGSFIDAKHQMETQRVLQTVRARAHKDYHPSNGMCEFGTSVRSLAATERRAELNAHVMSQRAQDRALGNTNTSAASGTDADFANRLDQYRDTFCDIDDHNQGLGLLCAYTGGGGAGATDPMRTNKDIDYMRTLEYPWTLNIDFTDTTVTEEEEEILALAGNLYGDTVFNRVIPATKFQDTAENPEGIRSLYLDARALAAKRSVAENSFNSIASMKAAGTSGSRQFLEAILTELGVSTTNGPPDDLLRMLGMDDADAPIGPSYHAQMEVLTKKIYQNPDFYTNLYDKPANVERKKVAMQAIALMQKFDLFKSYLRNEANLSVLLELALVDLQGVVENEFSSQKK